VTSLAGLEPWLAPWAAWLHSLYPYAQITSTRRSYQEQSALYDAYVRGASRYPAAPPGRSMHEYGRAWDMEAPEWALVQLGQIWERVGGRWGGRLGDPIHFEA
jgi:D-alanyl-D-alanine carboxypeptidase-like protein